MKLAFVIQKIAARSGGAERVLIDTANEMARRGHSVDILSHENRGVKPFYAIDPAIKHVNLFDRPIEHKDKERWKTREKIRENIPLFFPVNHIRWQMTHGGFVNQLRRYIRSAKPDLLIPFLPPAITPCVLAARGTATKVLASTHNAPEQDFENRDRWDPNPIDIKLRKKILREIDHILVLLPEYKNWYPTQVQEKVVDMPNAVTPVDPAVLAGNQREKLILAVGRLADVKRLDILINAWLHLRDEFPGWKVEIYGSGPNERELRHLIKRHQLGDVVSLRGTSNEISKQYLRASILCHPAEYEGFPLAVSEALAHGLPVIGFEDCTGLNTLVKDGVNGILVTSKGDRYGSMRDALEDVLAKPEVIAALGMAAPGSVAQYAPSLVYDRWEEVITRVHNGRQSY